MHGAGDAYPGDAPDLTPLYGISCDSTSLSTDFVKMPIGQWNSTFVYIMAKYQQIGLFTREHGLS